MTPLDDVGLSIVERPTPEVEAELVAACLKGDVAAQRALFRREFPRVNATIYRILGPTREVDDLVRRGVVVVIGENPDTPEETSDRLSPASSPNAPSASSRPVHE